MLFYVQNFNGKNVPYIHRAKLQYFSVAIYLIKLVSQPTFMTKIVCYYDNKINLRYWLSFIHVTYLVDVFFEDIMVM
jgi:hypothetical protein